ncbi:hypothetical protein GCM10010273_56390 [Streptomyces lavendulocolor]
MLTFNISHEMFAILICGCLAGLTVFRYTARTATGTATRGDLVGAVASAVAVITGLTLLFGMVGRSDSSASPTQSPQPSSSEFRQ